MGVCDAFLQLSYSASPEISVFVDGKKTGYSTTAINTIAIKTEKGSHTIDIVASPSKLRRTLFLISAATAIAAVWIIVWMIIASAFGRHKIFKHT